MTTHTYTHVKNKHILRPVRRNRPEKQEYTLRPVRHHRHSAVTIERRDKSPSLPWKVSVGRYLALGTSLNEAIANLFVKAITNNPNA